MKHTFGYISVTEYGEFREDKRFDAVSCLCFWLLLAYQSRSTVRALIGGISTRAVHPGAHPLFLYHRYRCYREQIVI